MLHRSLRSSPKRRRQVKLVLVERNLKPFYSHR
jgi:hypothetical protein